MPRLPALSAKDLIRALERVGFSVVRQRGSHIRLKHEDGRFVTVPLHAGQDVSRGLLRKILRDAELSPRDLEKLLKD
jgi:predicted RNA binding protein YcfA (HicA-like mRNA interferase family)